MNTRPRREPEDPDAGQLDQLHGEAAADPQHTPRDQSADLASAEPEPEQQAAADEAGRLVPRSAAEG